ncbi:MAG TPA: hypothetical protein DD490_32115, partial [Acidobacteria bacterium]|nr:hypothetical protein [Acidobacteriota bacterium]
MKAAKAELRRFLKSFCEQFDDPRGDAVSPTTRFVLFPGGARGSVWAALNSRGQAPEIPAAHPAEPA